MEKHKTVAFVCLSIIIVVIIIFMYQTISKENGKDAKEKTLAEVEFIEVPLRPAQKS